MNRLQSYSEKSILHDAWLKLRVGMTDEPNGDAKLTEALALYERVIGTAPRGSLELRAALIGAGTVHLHRGDEDQVDAYTDAIAETEQAKIHPKQTQLCIPIDLLMHLPYVRRHDLWLSGPGKFRPGKLYLGDQKIIVASVWRRERQFRGHAWVGSLFWLKRYDPPYDWTVYYGGPSRPCEAVDPISVAAALGLSPVEVFG